MQLLEGLLVLCLLVLAKLDRVDVELLEGPFELIVHDRLHLSHHWPTFHMLDLLLPARCQNYSVVSSLQLSFESLLSVPEGLRPVRMLHVLHVYQVVAARC